jgi:polyhydroxybutyrate depolymerase
MGTKDSGHDTGPAMGTHSSGVAISVKTASGSVMRTYSITLPAVCDSSNPLPLVFAFHGDYGNGEGMYSSFPIEAAAAAAGGTAIFVYPDGTNNNIDPDGMPRAWDLYHDPGPPPYTYTPGQPVPAMSDEASGNEDVDFFDTMVETFEKNYCVDTSKVWVTGMSSGGYLSNQFGRWRSTVIKAIAPQSGALPFGNMDSQAGTWTPPNYCISYNGAVPAIIIHGLADTTVAPCDAVEAESYWDSANGCADSANNCSPTADSCTGTNLTIPPPAPTTVSPLNADCIQTTGCGANPVVLCQVPGMGHSIWSDAPQVIWSFFTGL